MRKPNAIAVSVIGLGVAVLLGCSGGQPSGADSSPRSSGVAAADPTPTPSPTVELTTAPSVQPTPEPTPNAALLRWDRFGGHMQADRLTDLMVVFTELKANDFKGFVAFAKKLRGWTKSEKTWLKANPAHECYLPTFVHYRRAVLAYDKAALAMIAGYPTLSLRKIDQAFDAMKAADGHILKAAGSMPASQAACVGL